MPVNESEDERDESMRMDVWNANVIERAVGAVDVDVERAEGVYAVVVGVIAIGVVDVKKAVSTVVVANPADSHSTSVREHGLEQ